MGTLLHQNRVLSELRLDDFERTQLLILSTELDALSFPPHLAPPQPRSEKLKKQRQRQVWYGKRSVLQVAWLCTYPFLLWARDFSGVIAQTVVSQGRRVKRRKRDYAATNATNAAHNADSEHLHASDSGHVAEHSHGSGSVHSVNSADAADSAQGSDSGYLTRAGRDSHKQHNAQTGENGRNGQTGQNGHSAESTGQGRTASVKGTFGRVVEHKRDIIRWLFFLILAPILGFLSILWNLTLYIAPGLVHAVMERGVNSVSADGMIRNVDVDRALRDMSAGTKGIYNHVIAEYLCLVSAMSYMRSPTIYARAEKMYRKLVAIDGEYLPTEPVLNKLPESDKANILRTIEESEASLRKHALDIGLEASVMSELDTGLGGPTATMYVSKRHSVLIIGISGTNPYDFREILLDAAFDKVTAFKSYFHFLEDAPKGKLHRGFYSSLFSLTKDATYPAKRMREAILAQAKLMRAGRHDAPTVKVYITGHSLGAATASIFATSLSDIGSDVELCEVYTYGTPMNSDGAFCKSYDASMTGMPIWRVINGRDFVTRIPPSINLVISDGGCYDMGTVDAMFDGTILDYSAPGYGIRYDSTDKVPAQLKRCKWTCDIASDNKVSCAFWVRILLRTPLKPLVQHSTISYSATLKAARAVMYQQSA